MEQVGYGHELLQWFVHFLTAAADVGLHRLQDDILGLFLYMLYPISPTTACTTSFASVAAVTFERVAKHYVDTYYLRQVMLTLEQARCRHKQKQEESWGGLHLSYAAR